MNPTPHTYQTGAFTYASIRIGACMVKPVKPSALPRVLATLIPRKR